MLDLNQNDELEIREFDGIGGFITCGSGFIDRNQENAPLAILSVDRAGNFSKFSPELVGLKSPTYGDFVMGNVLNDNLASIADSTKFQEISRDVDEAVARCRAECEYRGRAAGGLPSNRYFENGTFASTGTLHCALSKKALLDVVLARLESGRANGGVADSCQDERKSAARQALPHFQSVRLVADHFAVSSQPKGKKTAQCVHAGLARRGD